MVRRPFGQIPTRQTCCLLVLASSKKPFKPSTMLPPFSIIARNRSMQKATDWPRSSSVLTPNRAGSERAFDMMPKGSMMTCMVCQATCCSGVAAAMRAVQILPASVKGQVVVCNFAEHTDCDWCALRVPALYYVQSYQRCYQARRGQW